MRDLAMLNLAIDSKLRGCDLVSLKVEDVAPHGFALERATARQRKTGHPVKFELTEQTREAIDTYITRFGRRSGGSCSPAVAIVRAASQPDDTRAYSQTGRQASDWTPRIFGTHSLRRTKAALIYRRTGNLRAVQLLLGHTKIESTVRYLGIEVDDALTIAEQVDV
jgi:integrase